jgi:hypothetical protein
LNKNFGIPCLYARMYRCELDENHIKYIGEYLKNYENKGE